MGTNTAENRTCQRQPIIDVVGEFVTLQQHGHEFWGLCPFHAEKTPSFAVNPAKELFYCHGCHVGGDVITFIQKIRRN